MRVGEIAVVGRPNVGKSTLVNALVGEKVAIVSDKPQTTRTRVLGVARRPGAEIALVDTPGIHRPQYRMNAAMVREATESLSGADGILFVLDAAAERGAGDKAVAELCRKAGAPVVLAVNKIDLLRRDRLLPLLAGLGEDPVCRAFADIVPVSAKTGENVDHLFTVLAGAPAGGRRRLPRRLPDRDPGDRVDRGGHPGEAPRAHPRRASVRACGRHRVGAARSGPGHHGRRRDHRRRARGPEGDRRRKGRDDDPFDRPVGARGARATSSEGASTSS